MLSKDWLKNKFLDAKSQFDDVRNEMKEGIHDLKRFIGEKTWPDTGDINDITKADPFAELCDMNDS
jgi:hypothetical protein